ncbi:MAG: ATP-binding protein [candidate division Zixibacteria bacterium]|nr:ATP-binding protein [candidate division Zixibacteria bacterium]
MAEEEKGKITPEELGAFADSYASFNKIIQKLHQAYKDLEDKFENLNLELEQTNLKLRESLVEKEKITNYLNNILESLTSGVLVVNLEGKITLFNRAAEEITGYKAEEILNRPYLEVMGKGINLQATPIYTMRSGNSHLNEEKEIFTKFETKIPLGYSTSLLKDGEDNLLGVVEVFFDLSKIKKLEDEIARVRTLAALGEMAATVAHEVKNPLNGILGFADLLYRDIEEHDPRRNYAKKIIEGVEILNRIVMNLLDYTRSIKLDLRPIDFARFLDEVVSFFEMDLSRGKKNFKIERLYTNTRVNCLLDSEKFKQIVLNLLYNASQALPEGGLIQIFAGIESMYAEGKIPGLSAGQMVSLKIKDNGIGMTEEIKNKLFTPFFTTKEKGTGLGLSTVKKIVQALKGEIEIDSQLGKGTTVTVLFPKNG